MRASQLKHQQLTPQLVALQADGKLGVENIKAVFTILITFLVDLFEVFTKGNWMQLANTIFNILRFGNIVVVAKDAWAEFQDTSAEESREIVEHIKAELDLENDELESTIEAAISLIPEIYDLAMEVLAIGGTALDIWKRAKDVFGPGGKVARLMKSEEVAAAVS